MKNHNCARERNELRRFLLSAIVGIVSGVIYSLLFIGKEIREITFFVFLGFGVALGYYLSRLNTERVRKYFKLLLRSILIGALCGLVSGLLGSSLIYISFLKGGILGVLVSVLFITTINSALFICRERSKLFTLIVILLTLVGTAYVTAYIVATLLLNAKGGYLFLG